MPKNTVEEEARIKRERQRMKAMGMSEEAISDALMMAKDREKELKAGRVSPARRKYG